MPGLGKWRGDGLCTSWWLLGQGITGVPWLWQGMGQTLSGYRLVSAVLSKIRNRIRNKTSEYEKDNTHNCNSALEVIMEIINDWRVRQNIRKVWTLNNPFTWANDSLGLSQWLSGLEVMVGSTTGDDSLGCRQWLPQDETIIVCANSRKQGLLIVLNGWSNRQGVSFLVKKVSNCLSVRGKCVTLQPIWSDNTEKIWQKAWICYRTWLLFDCVKRPEVTRCGDDIQK